ncbi:MULTISPECIES: hypothetical protein [Mahella]|nr:MULTISPECIES: hypothetical protein [Mahella]
MGKLQWHAADDPSIAEAREGGASVRKRYCSGMNLYAANDAVYSVACLE